MYLYMLTAANYTRIPYMIHCTSPYYYQFGSSQTALEHHAQILYPINNNELAGNEK